MKNLPFHCGTQSVDWECQNCDHCKKNDDARSCPIQEALDEAECDDGSVPDEIYEQMGAKAFGGHYVWPCNNLESTSEEHRESAEAFREKWTKTDAGTA